MPALIAVIGGVLLGLACGGTLYGLRDLKLRWEWLVLPLFVVQAVSRGRLLGIVGASQWSLVVWVGASSALVFALLSNWRTPGMVLGAVGIMMNLDGVLLNRAMPVVIGQKAGLSTVTAAQVAMGTGGFYRLARPGDLLVWLGDSMPVVLGPSEMMISPGDIVLMVAIAVTIVSAMVVVRDGGGAY
jgi:hypothetical protein